MKRHLTPNRPCIAAALCAAAMLPATALLAQEAVPTVQPTAPAAQPAAAPAPAPSQAPVFRAPQAVVQPTPPRPVPPVEAAAPAAEEAAPAPARRAATRAAPRRAETRAAPAPVAPLAATRAVTPEPAPTPPVAEATPPVEAAPAVDPLLAESGNPEAVEDTSVSTTPWLAIAAIAALAALVIGFLLRRRRRPVEEVGYTKASYVPTDETGAPVPTVDLAERPWIRLALQPTRSETYNGEQTVDYQLIVENEGKIAARDVRVSSFLTGVAGANPSDALRGEQSQTHHIDVEPGQSVPLPGTVTVRDGSDPKIVADARYALPDGGEGHLAALFGIDTSNDEPEAQVEDVLERV